MSLDLSALSPSARATYIALGKQFSSTDTLRQANQTLLALGKHGPELIQHGFTQSDAQRLAGARDALTAATQDRTGAQGNKKITSASYLAAMRDGKAARATARSILQTTRRVLHEQGDAPAKAAVQVVDTALGQTSSAGSSAAKLAGQLDTLRETFGDATIASTAADRGGPAALAALQAQANALRAAGNERTGVKGTPVETEDMDVLDGLIVTLSRDARRAAREAARRTGKPALAAEFELTALYASRSASPADPAAPPNG